MLLRLLPAPSAAQPAPPTILFTLPLPVNPYTSKSLPLPPLLQQHRTACHQEGLECSNALLGEKSSWISGIIDEVTFCISAGRITVHFIDGTTCVLPINDNCMVTLFAVIAQVQLSFAVPASPPVSPVSPGLSRNSRGLVAGTSRRSPSTLLCSLLSPLLSPGATRAAEIKPVQNSSRIHRRQARSLLVDAYRHHVQNVIKETLPSNYLGWVIRSELEGHQADWAKLRGDVDALLNVAGVPATRQNFRATLLAARMARSALATVSEGESNSAGSDSSSDDESGPSTPATSVFSHSTDGFSNPISQLSTLPVASSLPMEHRERYTSMVSELSSIASRMASLRKRRGAMEREEGRRSWLESMEASRQQDRAQRRAWSNRASQHPSNYAFSRPIKVSSLWYVESAEQEEVPRHPVAMEDCEMDSGSLADSDQEDVFASDISVRPLSPSAYEQAPRRPRMVSTSSTASTDSSSSDESDDMDTDVEAPPRKVLRTWTRESLSNSIVAQTTDYQTMGKDSWRVPSTNEVVVVEA